MDKLIFNKNRKIYHMEEELKRCSMVILIKFYRENVVGFLGGIELIRKYL